MATKVMLHSFLVNLLLGIIKIIGGLVTGSKTLLSDGVHCMSDMATDVVGIIGAKIASKKADASHPFGHGKMEYVTSIFMSTLIIILGVTIFINSFEQNNSYTSIYAVIVLTICIFIKFLLSKYLLRKGKELNNEILITNGTESKYDTYSSIFGLVFIIMSLFKNKFKILSYADAIGSIIISLFTIKIGLSLFIKNIKSVLGEIDDSIEINDKLKETVLKNKTVLDITNLMILKYGHYSSVIVDINMDECITIKEAYKIERKIKKDLKRSDNRIKYITVNIRPKKNIKHQT